jgi:phosphopantetheinyl transferase (holo-ACP synthase)
MSSVWVGNDVVDLGNPRTQGRAGDDRFVARVFDEDERQAIHSTEEPDLELWCRWAAKEAGYKAIAKLVGEPLAFVHRAFKVAWSVVGADAAHHDSVDAGRMIRRGCVGRGTRHVEVSVMRHRSAVHAVAFAARSQSERWPRVRARVARLDAPASPWAGSLEHLLPLLSEREADAVYSVPSAAVRVGARGDLAGAIGVAERRVEIVCGPGAVGRRPPRVLLDGEETEADVSLSHDGPLIAWAVWAGLNQGDAP